MRPAGIMPATIACFLLFACGGNGDGGRDVSTPDNTFALRPVLEESAPPCDSDAPGKEIDVVPEFRDGAATACLTLGPAIVDASDVRTASLGNLASGGRSVSIVLGRTGGANLDDHAARSLGSRLAIVVHGKLVKAPTISLPTFAGRIEVVGLSDDEALQLFEDLQSRRRSAP